MTAVVVLVLVWALLAAATAFVIGHGIRLADASRPARQVGDEAWTTAHQGQPVPAS